MATKTTLTVVQKDVKLALKNWSGSGGCPGPHFGGIFDDFSDDFGVILDSFFLMFFRVGILSYRGGVATLLLWFYCDIAAGLLSYYCGIAVVLVCYCFGISG